MTSGARGSPIQVPRSSLEAAGARDWWAKDMPYSYLGLADRDPSQGLSSFPQAWALDLLEWAVAASSGALRSAATGLQPPGTVWGAEQAGKLGCFLALSLPLGF